MISRHLPLHIDDSLIDAEGRYLYIKGTLWGRPITLANIYSPNKAQVGFFREITQVLAAFQSGILIVRGDFNVTLNPLEDTLTGSSTIPFQALKQIKLQLHDLLLHDTWRTLNPNTKDYTFFSPPHNRYSRIDYPLLTQKDLPFLLNATIEPMVVSDHHPITLTL